MNAANVKVNGVESNIDPPEHRDDLQCNNMQNDDKETLVVHFAVSVGNYDYIMDWECQTDGLIQWVIHNHFVTFYLDMDVDGIDNSLVQVKMAKQTMQDGPTPRKSHLKAEKHIAQIEKDAQRKLSIYDPSKFHIINPSKKKKVGNSVGYKVVPGATVASLLDHNHPKQQGAFTNN
eukprot:Gb_37937 [translate_table: standard]